MKKAVEDKKSSTTDWSKLIARPNRVEVKAFREWSWVLEKYLSGLHEELE